MGPPCCCHQSSAVLCPDSTLVWAVFLALSSIVSPSEVKGRQAHLTLNQPDTLGQQDTERKWDLKASGSERRLGWQLAFLQPFSTYVATMAPGKIWAQLWFSLDPETLAQWELPARSVVTLMVSFIPLQTKAPPSWIPATLQCLELALAGSFFFLKHPSELGIQAQALCPFSPSRSTFSIQCSAAAGILKLSVVVWGECGIVGKKPSPASPGVAAEQWQPTLSSSFPFQDLAYLPGPNTTLLSPVGASHTPLWPAHTSGILLNDCWSGMVHSCQHHAGDVHLMRSGEPWLWSVPLILSALHTQRLAS